MSEPKLTNQVFPLLTASKCNLTTGTVECSLIHCVVSGSIDVTFSDGTGPTTIAMSAGQDYGFSKKASISITSGTYHVA